MRLYHVGDDAPTILERGFVDGASFYRSGKLHRGVWLFDAPTESGEDYGGPPERMVVVDVPDDIALRHEWVEETSSPRRFLLPARLANRYLKGSSARG